MTSSLKPIVLAVALLFLTGPANAADRIRKVVLLAGPLDKAHPRGTHEYEKTVRLLKHCLDHSPDKLAVAAEVHLDGWPADPRTLDDADAIVLVASGADRRALDHPFLVGDRLAVVEKQMKRGCGLVLLHWCTFVPSKPAGEKILDWVGGYFDYETGPPPRGWYSKIRTATTRSRPRRCDISPDWARTVALPAPRRILLQHPLPRARQTPRAHPHHAHSRREGRAYRRLGRRARRRRARLRLHRRPLLRQLEDRPVPHDGAQRRRLDGAHQRARNRRSLDHADRRPDRPGQRWQANPTGEGRNQAAPRQSWWRASSARPLTPPSPRWPLPAISATALRP